MKKLQYLAKTAISVMALSTVLFLSSCKDDCKDVTCNNGGTCIEGTCDCLTGYEGAECSTETRAKFIGTYTVAGSSACPTTGNGTISSLTLPISNSSSAANKIVINFAGANIVATVSGSGFTIDPNQTYTAGGVVYTYTGSGSITNTTINITLSEADPSIPETCIYTLSGPKN
jgi:hypothetical protein